MKNVITHRKLTEEELDRLFPKQKTIGEMNKKPYYFTIKNRNFDFYFFNIFLIGEFLYIK